MEFVDLAVDSELFQCLSYGGSADVEVLTQDAFRGDGISRFELDEYFPPHLIDQLEIQRDGIFLCSFQFVFHSRLPCLFRFLISHVFQIWFLISEMSPTGMVVHTSR